MAATGEVDVDGSTTGDTPCSVGCGAVRCEIRAGMVRDRARRGMVTSREVEWGGGRRVRRP
jgi:hypothetical protein